MMFCTSCERVHILYKKIVIFKKIIVENIDLIFYFFLLKPPLLTVKGLLAYHVKALNILYIFSDFKIFLVLKLLAEQIFIFDN